MPIRLRGQPYRFSFPLTADQVEALDDSFQILFDMQSRSDVNLASLGVGDLVYISAVSVLSGITAVSVGRYLRAAGVGVPPTWSTLTLPDTITNGALLIATSANVVGTLASAADATKFLNGAATPAYALVKDSDLSTSDITTNNVTTAKHGFTPKLPNDATKYLDGTGGYTVPPGTVSLTVQEQDGAPAVSGVSTIKLTNGTLTDNGGGTVSVAISAGASISTGADGSEPGGPNSGDLYLPNNGVYVERYSGSAWIPWGPIWPMVEPISGDFSWVNQSTASVDTTHGGVYLQVPALLATQTNPTMRLRKKAAPSAPYTITAAFIFNWLIAANKHAGLFFRESSSGKLATMAWGRSGTGAAGLKAIKYTDENTQSAAYNDPGHTFGPGMGAVCWLRIEDDNTNRNSYWSFDGYHWTLFHQVGRTDFLTANEVGFYANDNSNSTSTGILDMGAYLLSWKEA